jgi:hypothetical protein
MPTTEPFTVPRLTQTPQSMINPYACAHAHMGDNHALWRLRQARLPQDRTMTPTLLARDLGTKNCWALLASNNHVVSDTQSFKLQRLMSGGMRLLHAAIGQEGAA